MAIEFSQFLNTFTNEFYSVPMFNGIFSSVVYSSVLLSILLIIILLFINPVEKGLSGSILLKLFIYLVTVNAFIFSIHHSVISNNIKYKSHDANSNEFIMNINKRGGGIYDKENIKVMPMFKESTYKNRDEQDTESEPEQEQDTEYKVQTVSDMLDSVEKSI